jgi:putative membrane protein
MKKSLFLMSVAAVATLAACGPKADRAADQAGNSADNAMSVVGNTTANIADAVKDAVTRTPTGQEFVDTAAKSDAFEIAAAKLAATNASSADVKSFAKKMIAAHTESTAKIKAAAAKADPAIKPDATLTDDQSGKLADLRKLKGEDFDTAYVSGQVSAHKDALSLMKSYADKGEVKSLKTAAGEIAPIVQQHLDMVRALDK